MEQRSQIDVLEAQIRECYGRLVWTHKTQEKCADILHRRNNHVKVTQIILSALTTTGVLVAVFGDVKWIGVITALLSATLFGLNTYVKNYDLGEIAQKHAEAATVLWDIREKYLSLLADIRAGILTVAEIVMKRDSLQDVLYNSYKGSPRTIGKAYTEASKALKVNEELTFSDQEIDCLLPKALRKTCS